MTPNSSQTRSHRGQTIALVAVSMVSLLAVAALAIDLTTLYVAKGEIQRAADSAALAGAKAFVDSGVTTYPTNTGLQSVAQALVNSYAVAAAGQNNVAGAPIAPAAVRAAEEKRHAERDQQQRADQVKHADRDEAQVPGDAERADDDECDGEDSHGTGAESSGVE